MMMTGLNSGVGGEYADTLRALANAIEQGDATLTAVAARSVMRGDEVDAHTLTIEYTTPINRPQPAARPLSDPRAHVINPDSGRCVNCGLKGAEIKDWPHACVEIELLHLNKLADVRPDFPGLAGRIAELQAALGIVTPSNPAGATD